MLFAVRVEYLQKSLKIAIKVIIYGRNKANHEN